MSMGAITVNRSDVLISLCVLAQIFAATTLNGVQIVLELIIIAFLLILIVESRVKKKDAIVIFIIVVCCLLSLYNNPVSAALLSVKLYLTPVLIFIYFKDRSISLSLLNLVFFLNVLGLCIFVLFSVNIFGFLDGLIANDNIADHGFSGLFLNYHFTADFMAIMMIGYSLKYRLYFLDYIYLFILFVPTALLSYFGQQQFLRITRKRKALNSVNQVYVFISIVFVLFVFNEVILNIFGVYGKKLGSITIILDQFFNKEFWLGALNLFPNDIVKHHNEHFTYYRGVPIVNEIGYITLTMQGGLIIVISIISLVYKDMKYFLLYFLLTMIHYSYFLSPLVIYSCLAINFNFGKDHNIVS